MKYCVLENKLIKKTDLSHGSLFAGIGGFEEGAKMSGIRTVWSCEIEKFQRAILLKKNPETYQYEDIRKMHKPGYVDIISGGFPCQDISVAGGGAGISGERSGMWGEMFRILWQVRPKYAIIENSPALTVRGFERVLLDLFKIGYNAEWQCISNLAFGFPHKRERIYVIAYANQVGFKSDVCEERGFRSVFKQFTSKKGYGYSLSKRIHEIPAHNVIRNGDGVSNWSYRVGSIGNAVNPIISNYLFECIKEFDNQNELISR